MVGIKINLILVLTKGDGILLSNPTLGTPLGDNLYKIRIPNSSIPTGKSGGFRVITLVKITDDKIILDTRTLEYIKKLNK